MPTSLRPVAAGPLCARHPEPCVSSGSNSRTGDPVDTAVLCVREEARELSWPTSLFASRSGSQPQAPSSKPLESPGCLDKQGPFQAGRCGADKGSQLRDKEDSHRAAERNAPAGPQPPWWDQHRCPAEGSRGAPDVWLLSSVCPCWAAAGVTSTVLLFLALQLAKQQPYPQSRAFAHTATPIPAPPAVLWQPLPKMQPQGPALRRPPGPPSPHVVLLSVPAASVPAACTLSPALQGSGGQDTTVRGSSRSRQPATAAAGRCHQDYTLHGAGRSPAPSELQACNFCSHPSCNCRSESSCGLPGQVHKHPRLNQSKAEDGEATGD
ncbi:PREDICTED: uncharacterized protein LOC105598321 isoform X2 [Cercocebus atys]|uniref:uncharacterized protein LOC105598321 isoform X2 n=1 Tax=Cercocebus atys TaxID=9531 RepID=UPI0005F57F32|nr:PREDICTED: uncharacterized protein LOC105598321 isoform X2 [Cercocebus atys]